MRFYDSVVPDTLMTVNISICSFAQSAQICKVYESKAFQQKHIYYKAVCNECNLRCA